MIDAKDKFHDSILRFLSHYDDVNLRPLKESNSKYLYNKYIYGVTNGESIVDYSFTSFNNRVVLIEGLVNFADKNGNRHEAMVFYLFDNEIDIPLASYAAEIKVNSDLLKCERCAVVVNNKYGIFYEGNSLFNSRHKSVEKVANIPLIKSSDCILDLLIGEDLDKYIITYTNGVPTVSHNEENIDGANFITNVNDSIESTLLDIQCLTTTAFALKKAE